VQTNEKSLALINSVLTDIGVLERPLYRGGVVTFAKLTDKNYDGTIVFKTLSLV